MQASERKTTTLYWTSIVCAQGECIVMATEQGVCWLGTPRSTLEYGLEHARRWLQIDQVVQGVEVEPLEQAVAELQRYFRGEHITFTCPLDMHGTPFQLSVWHELCNIGYGQTCSYGDIARAIGHPKASRAVGAANGANPIAIIVPCHRVIGSNKTLTGYGGGLPMKSWLLSLEGVINAQPLLPGIA